MNDVSWSFAHDLEPFVYSQLSAVHPQKTLLYPAFLSSAARHQVIKAELLELLTSWHKHGFLVMLYKGFYLNEFVYGVPGERVYIDVDILVREEQWKEMSDIAQELGWECHYRSGDDFRSHHEIAHLYSPRLHFKVDIHRSLTSKIGEQKTTRINQKVWQSAVKMTWEGIHVFVPNPLDCILLGLVLHRLRSIYGKIVLRDYLDFKHLIRKFHFSERDLLSRARALQIEKTTRCFLSYCNPFHLHYKATPTSWLQRLRERYSIIEEIGLISRQSFLIKWSASRISLLMLYHIPDVLKSVMLRKSLPNLKEYLDALTVSLQTEAVTLRVISTDTNKAVEKLLWWCRSENRSVFYASTLFLIYRRLGQPVCFLFGHDGDGKTHAWLELAGIPVSSPHDRYARRKYTVLFQYPPSAET